MYRILIISIVIILIGQNLSAQSSLFFRLYPELDSNVSNGVGIFPDNQGYFLLYTTSSQSYIPKTSISRFDSLNNILWTQDYHVSVSGTVATSDLMLTSDSSFVFCGFTFDSITKAFLAKVDYETGNIEFIRSYGLNSCYAFYNTYETADSNYLVVGMTDSIHHGSYYKYDMYIMKVDTIGNILWDTVIYLTNNYDGNYSVVEKNNKFYIATVDIISRSNYKSYLFCLNNDGSFVYKKEISMGFYGGMIPYMIESKDGNLLMGGRSFDHVWADDGSIYEGHPYGHLFIAKYDTLGNEIWSKKLFVSTFIQMVTEIASVNEGYIVSGGTGWGWMSLYDSLYLSPNKSVTDIFLMKITENGDSLWMRMYRKQDGCSINPNAWALQDMAIASEIFDNGDIGVTGDIFPTLPMNPPPKQYAWVLKTDSNGCGKPGTPYGLWREELPYNQDSSIVHLTWLDDDTSNVWHHVQGSKDGQYYFWELTSRPVTNKEFFDTVPKYHNYCYRVFGLDTTWARTCESAEICITTGIHEYGPETGLLRVYPNPASNIINCVLPDNENYEIVVYNVLGTNAFSTSLEVTFGDDLCTIKISQLPAGIYFIEARGKKVLRGKFVKN